MRLQVQVTVSEQPGHTVSTTQRRTARRCLGPRARDRLSEQLEPGHTQQACGLQVSSPAPACPDLWRTRKTDFKFTVTNTNTGNRSASASRPGATSGPGLGPGPEADLGQHPYVECRAKPELNLNTHWHCPGRNSVTAPS
eukprot:1513924-Rhodomonas_salina.1